MALARTHAMALAGVQGHVVEIEADIENGLVALFLVGLPDTALREARDRIRAAIVNSRQTWPLRRVTVGLSPASLPKRGSGFDLGIAVAILAADDAVAKDRLAGTVFVGELGLDGRLRPVPGCCRRWRARLPRASARWSYRRRTRRRQYSSPACRWSARQAWQPSSAGCARSIPASAASWWRCWTRAPALLLA
jgi:hypothetical protein